jgi:hypothetical protein
MRGLVPSINSTNRKLCRRPQIIATVRTIYSTTNPLEGLKKLQNNPHIFNTIFNHGKFSVVEAR